MSHDETSTVIGTPFLSAQSRRVVGSGIAVGVGIAVAVASETLVGIAMGIAVLVGKSVFVDAGVAVGVGVTPQAASTKPTDDVPHNLKKSRRVN